MSWEEVLTSEVVDVRDGTHDSPKYVDVGYFLVTSKNLRDGVVDFENVNLISREDYEAINKRSKVDKGDILYSMIGSVGNYALVTDEPNYAIKNVALFKFIDNRLFNKFFLYLLNSPIVERQIEHAMKGGTQKFVSLKVLRNLKIPLPPLNQQKKIAAILDAADAYRQKTKALIAKYDELTQSVFLEMFGDPKLNNKGFERGLIGDLVKIQGGSQPPKKLFKSEWEEGYVRLVQIRDYKTDKYLTFVPENSTKKFCSTDDIMIGRYGPPVFQILRGIAGAYNVALMKAKPLEEMNSEYIFHLFSCDYVQNIIIGNSQRTAGQSGVNLKLLNSIEISKPPIELQNLFEERVKVIQSQKAQAQQSLIKAEELFNSLLQKAFKGELTA